MVPGGKGANQAVAAARLGAEVTLVARLGDDLFAEASLRSFREAGIRTEAVVRDPEAASGVALILVDESGENAIAVAPGANARLTPADETGAELLLGGGAAASAWGGIAAVADALRAKGAGTVIVTLGREGAFVVGPGGSVHVPGRHVKAVDTTAAGDAFTGALACAL